MKRGIAVLVCLCALSGTAYYAISKWGVQHETLNLFDALGSGPSLSTLPCAGITR